MKAAQPARKPVSNVQEAYCLPASIRSPFARMLLPAPWLEEVPAAGLSLLDRLKQAALRLVGQGDLTEKIYRRVRVAPGQEITDRYGCSYHVGRDGSLRLGVAHQTLPDELLDDDGKPLRGRPRRRLLRQAKGLVQRLHRRLRTRRGAALRFDSPGGSAGSLATVEAALA